MVPREIASVLFAIWLVLVLLGKGGFVHLILFTAVGVALVDLMAVYRARMTMTDAGKL